MLEFEYSPEEEEQEEKEEDKTDEEEEEKTKPRTFTQEELEEILTRRLARERSRSRKEMAEMFGAKDLQEAVQLYRAGQVVVQASGKTPAEVIQRVQQQYGQTQPVGAPAGGDDIRQELGQIKEYLSMEREEKVRLVQDTEAKKQFGDLYDKHKDEVAHLAEERGLSLQEAAAIVLTPRLREHLEAQAQRQQEARRRKKVESTAEGVQKGDEDVASRLTARERRAAAQFGMTPTEYYTQKKDLGEIEE